MIYDLHIDASAKAAMAIKRKAWMVTMGLLALAPTVGSCGVAPEDFAGLAARCAGDVHPDTLRAVVAQESAFDPLVIGINGTEKRAVHPLTTDAAVAAAMRFIEQGRSIDVGLGQINSRNFRLLGLTVRAAFDPCQNLAASARLLRASYTRLLSSGRSTAAALDGAISEYNTGKPDAGIANGYVAAVRGQAANEYAVPSIATSASVGSPSAPAVLVAEPKTPPAPWDVFGDATAGSADGMTAPATTATATSPAEPAAAPQAAAAVVLFSAPERPN